MNVLNLCNTFCSLWYNFIPLGIFFLKSIKKLLKYLVNLRKVRTFALSKENNNILNSLKIWQVLSLQLKQIILKLLQ